MNLREWLFRERKTVTELAKKIVVSRTHLNLVSTGKKRPSPDLAKKIEEATNGKVTRDELLFPEDYE
ncbi:MAG: helix-turn-helix domain-containing protein [Pseudomonadota bacterium]